MNITEREKKYLGAAVVFFVLVLGYYGSTTLFSAFTEFGKDEKAMREQMNTLTSLGVEYKGLQTLHKHDSVDLDPMVPQIEILLNNNGLADQSKIKPSDSTVENKYRKRSVQIHIREGSAIQFLQFIQSLENSASLPMVIDSFSASPVGKKPGIYRVNITVSAFQVKKEK